MRLQYPHSCFFKVPKVPESLESVSELLKSSPECNPKAQKEMKKDKLKKDVVEEVTRNKESSNKGRRAQSQESEDMEETEVKKMKKSTL